MKTLYLLRHAKSSWSNPNLSDHERPLNTRGEDDIPRMANWLAKKLSAPQAVLSSDSVRTRLTLAPVAQTWPISEDKITFTRQVYHASADRLLRLLRETSNEHDCLLMVGHNPGFTEFANELAKTRITDNLPTSGFVALTFDVKSWNEVKAGTGQLLAYQYPKNL